LKLPNKEKWLTDLNEQCLWSAMKKIFHGIEFKNSLANELIYKRKWQQSKAKKIWQKNNLKEENKNFIHDCINISTRKAIDIKYLKLSVCRT